MASSEIYFKEVVVVTTIPINKTNLGEAILKDIEKKTFPKDTTFYVVCGFHTKVRSDLLSYFMHTTLTKFFIEFLYLKIFFFLFGTKNRPNNVWYHTAWIWI